MRDEDLTEFSFVWYLLAKNVWGWPGDFLNLSIFLDKERQETLLNIARSVSSNNFFRFTSSPTWPQWNSIENIKDQIHVDNNCILKLKPSTQSDYLEWLTKWNSISWAMKRLIRWIRLSTFRKGQTSYQKSTRQLYVEKVSFYS